MFSHPEFTKKTRTNNNLAGKNLDINNNFLRPVLSNKSVPLVYNHDHYMNDKNAFSFDIERSFIPTRNSGDLISTNESIEKSRKINSSEQNNYYNNSSILMNGGEIPFQSRPVQESIQNNNFLTFNQFHPPQLKDDLEVNNFLTRNPVNSRRDAMEKVRNTERKSFINNQGGLMNNFVDFNLENTRKDKKEINTTNYVPMPRTLAIPKENI